MNLPIYTFVTVTGTDLPDRINAASPFSEKSFIHVSRHMNMKLIPP